VEEETSKPWHPCRLDQQELWLFPAHVRRRVINLAKGGGIILPLL